MAHTAAAIHSTDVPTYPIGTVGATGTGKSVFLKKVVGESTIDGYEATQVGEFYTLDGCCKGDKILARLVCYDIPGGSGVDVGGFEGIEGLDANSPLWPKPSIHASILKLSYNPWECWCADDRIYQSYNDGEALRYGQSPIKMGAWTGGVKAFLVFYDVTNSSSYSDAQRWCNLITSVSGHVPVAICGTKVDLRSNETEIVGLDNQMKHFEISVKTDSMIKLQEPLLYLLTELMGATKVEYLKAQAFSKPSAKTSFETDLEAQNAPVARDTTTLEKIKKCCKCCGLLVTIALKIWAVFFGTGTGLNEN